jgi:hypothetical protein
LNTPPTKIGFHTISARVRLMTSWIRVNAKYVHGEEQSKKNSRRLFIRSCHSKKFVMAGLDPATQGQGPHADPNSNASLCEPWVAGSRFACPAMTDIFFKAPTPA